MGSCGFLIQQHNGQFKLCLWYCLFSVGVIVRHIWKVVDCKILQLYTTLLQAATSVTDCIFNATSNEMIIQQSWNLPGEFDWTNEVLVDVSVTRI